MGANAALVTKKVIENGFEVVAIELITIVQAIEYLDVQDKVSKKTRELYDTIRELVPAFSEDQTLYPYIKKVKHELLK